MPSELFKRINLDLFYPRFLEVILNVIAECSERGGDYYAIRGFASYAEQDALFAQGRTAPGNVVTRARGGESAHNFGLACDFCRDGDATKEGLQPAWKDTDYALLGEVAQSHGLVWGASFPTPDRPHVQWPGFVSGSQMAALRALVKPGAPKLWLPAVWDYVKEH